MPNPSTEAAALEQELVEQKVIALNRGWRYGKAEREASLRRVRQLEEALGLPSEPYNSNRFAVPNSTTRPDTVSISRETLGILLDAADSHLTDLESGLDDGTCEDNGGLAPLVQATKAARELLD